MRVTVPVHCLPTVDRIVTVRAAGVRRTGHAWRSAALATPDFACEKARAALRRILPLHTDVGILHSALFTDVQLTWSRALRLYAFRWHGLSQFRVFDHART
eukprot:2179459-Prymnesium_polylepis.1